jgi:hypothetical protein
MLELGNQIIWNMRDAQPRLLCGYALQSAVHLRRSLV